MKAAKVKQICTQAFDQLVTEVERGESSQLKQYLNFMAKFHRYSFRNTLLILSQMPRASKVAGFCTWKRLGRKIRKNEKGIAIFVPLAHRKKTVDQLMQADEEKSELEAVQGYRVGHVFDISQLADCDKPLPEFSRVDGDPGLYLERLRDYVASKGIKLTFTHLYGTTQGYSAGGRIVLKSGLSQAQQMSVLLHEVAHERLHRNQDAKKLERKIVETEAEAVSYVVCSGIGLDLNTAHRDYLHLYDGDKKTLMQSLQRIQRTAAEILQAITETSAVESKNT